MRHLNMKACIIGQNPKVGRAGLQWSDMGQVVAIYLGSGCLDVIGAHPHLKRKAEELSEQYYELSEWCEFENRKLPVESRYLFGLLVIPGNKPQWFVLPPANQIVIDARNNTIATSMQVTNSNSQKKEAQSTDQKLNKSLHNYSLVQNLDGVQTQSEQELQDLIDLPFRSDSSVLIDHADQGDLPKCRIHPEAELRTCKDGRYYCPSCKKVLGKNGLS
jgi:hypothetical protein